MYVCICNGITENQVRSAAKAGVRNLWGLQAELGVASSCGSCKDAAMAIVRETRDVVTRVEPVVYYPAAAPATP